MFRGFFSGSLGQVEPPTAPPTPSPGLTAAQNRLKSSLSSRWTAWLWTATMAGTATATAGGAAAVIEDVGGAVSLKLTTVFIAHFTQLCEKVFSQSEVNLGELTRKLERAARESENYVCFLDSIGADVPPPMVVNLPGSMWSSRLQAGPRPVGLAAQKLAALQRAGPNLSAQFGESMGWSATVPFGTDVTDHSAGGTLHLHPSLHGTQGRLAECVVCLSALTPQELLVRSENLICGKYHVYHADCLPAEYAAQSGCPICRRPITELRYFKMPTPFLPAKQAARYQRWVKAASSFGTKP